MYLPKPYNEGFLPEVDGHSVYFAEYGNSDGEVIVSLHGGPGSKSKPKHAMRFDLTKYRVVLFDQRGSGKSESAGKIEENTTQHLVADIERLRKMLGVESWFVAGSSWGSTLALLYAEAHAERVKGLLISAIFLADSASLAWFNKTPNGAALAYTDVWEKRIEDLAKLGAAAENAAEVLYEKLCSGSEEEKRAATAIFENWEANLLTSLKEITYANDDEVTEEDINSAKLFLHYEVHDFFIEPDQIMKNVDHLADIPAMLFHGRHDMICPFEQAWKLHKALPKSRLAVAPQSNHLFSPDGEVGRYYAFDSFLNEVA